MYKDKLFNHSKNNRGHIKQNAEQYVHGRGSATPTYSKTLSLIHSHFTVFTLLYWVLFHANSAGHVCFHTCMSCAIPRK